MKLKNKISGEIKEFALFDGNELQGGATLESLTKEWEDYEVPKGYWYIRDDGSGVGFSPLDDSTVAHRRSIIGNYFETKEEAEKAVEKLKAWERLRDKGFRFNNFVRDAIYFEISDKEIEKDIVRKDLDLLFGGEK